MDTISRRRFIQVLGMGAIAASAPMLTLQDIARASAASPSQVGTPVLVLVTLYGGNDGLNTLAPYTDPIYQSSRPGISLAAHQVLDVGEGLGLNSTMTGFKSLWDSGNLAIVRGVGYPNPNLSHFSSMAIWQTGSPSQQAESGWLGRWLDSQTHDPMRAIALGSVLPPVLAGTKQIGSVLPLGGLQIPSGTFASDCKKLSAPSASDSPLMTQAAQSMSDLFNLSSTVTPILQQPAPVSDPLPSSVGSTFGGDSALSAQLDVVAKLIAANAPTKVWAVSLGGFDTHADELNSQSALIGMVSDSVTNFMGQMHHAGRDQDVTVMVYSEFGRRVKANASEGTDHGTASPVFLTGGKVKGGFFGEQPSLKDLDSDGDLKMTTDFRDVYGYVIEDILGTPVDQVLTGWSSKVDLSA